MNNYDFLSLLYSNTYSYFICLFVVIALYVFIYRKYYISILDPLVYSALGSGFGFAVVLFLYVNDGITFYYFSSYLLTQFAFFISFIFFSSRKNYVQRKVVFTDTESLHAMMFIVSSLIFIVSQLAVYKSVGIPLFMDSRLETFIDGSGFGIFGRLIEVSSFVALYTLFLLLFKQGKRSVAVKLYTNSFIGFFILSAILSGSKSNFLTLAVTFFMFIITNPPIQFRNETLFSFMKKNELKFIIVGLFLAVFVIILQRSGNFQDAISELMYRFVGYGDVYWYAYPNGSLENLNSTSPFLAIFSDILGVTRLESWSNLPDALGIELYRFFHPGDIVMGPNSRHNVFGYVYFGYYGSIFFSIILGMLVGLSRKKVLQLTNYSLIPKLFLVLIYTKIFTIESDPTLGLTSLDSIFIVYPIICLFSLILASNNSNSYA